MQRLSALMVSLAIFAALLAAPSSPTAAAAQGVPPVPPAEPLSATAIRVAFFADTGFEDLNGGDTLYPYDYLDQSIGLPPRTMKLVYAEGAELALHGGDIGYDTSDLDIPARWDQMVTDILGADFPLLASGGNHDARDWDGAHQNSGVGYATVLNDRYLAAEANPAIGPHLDCTFPTSSAEDIGQKGTCVYKDTLTIVTVGLGRAAPDGENPTNSGAPDNSFEAYLSGALASSTTPWAICNWHFNQSNLQTGSKSNEAGWKPYEYCRNAGALIATGHEHSYSRTHLMGSFAEDMDWTDIVTTGPDLTIDEGQTVAWVSGLGGRSIRGISDEAQSPWWAMQVNATNQSSAHGAGVLFCDFEIVTTTGGNANAQCYYKTVDGVVHERFEMVSNTNGATGTFQTPPTYGAVCNGRLVTIDLNVDVGADTDRPISDVILGTPGSDVISAGLGDDTVCAGGGDDNVIGGAGDDRIDGAAGNDVLKGRGGADTIFGGGGIDLIDGQGGSDLLNGGLDDDVIDGRGAADVIFGGDGNDTINGQNGGDTIEGGFGDDVLKGQIGPDVLDGGFGDDDLFGGEGADTLTGGDGVDNCAGNTGPDQAEAASCETTPGVEVLF